MVVTELSLVAVAVGVVADDFILYAISQSLETYI